MKVIEGPFDRWEPVSSPTAITVGVFDGVHRGHQYLLAELKQRAGSHPVCVVTFRQHPARVVMPTRAPKMLTTLDQRVELLERHGADVCAILDFDQRLRHADPESFVEQILVEKLRARWISVGTQFRFGYQLSGDVALLTDLGKRHGFDVEAIDIFGEDVPIRSTTIRAALGRGDVRAAARMLGRPFRLVGTVVEGARRGRRIGFPTANLAVDPTVMRPKWGVYAARAAYGGAVYDAVVNVGIRPTFAGESEEVEVHLIEGGGDLYGRRIEVDFVERIRDEMRFDGVESLAAQIAADVEVGKALLAAERSPGR